ncbi:hypothetical protein Hamer_G010400 [Homarus americanus]|uniref:Uncharacterized protein n=1 Tax=Homarus americanus TaxID=6706 RepID=A0A8J5MW75_HOMAM|nr:hypothetical protein Hamer_G010400 [Homarus americanus]
MFVIITRVSSSRGFESSSSQTHSIKGWDRTGVLQLESSLATQSKMHSSMLVFLLVVAVAAAAPAAPGAAGGIPPVFHPNTAVNAFIPAAAKAFIPSPEDIKALAALHTTAAPPPGAPAPASFKFGVNDTSPF